MPPEPMLQVFIFQNGEYVDTDVFSQGRILVGRDAGSADLVLASTHVSRRHAVIEHDGQQVHIQDAGSKNGVYVNDKKVQRSLITRNDKITIGNFTLKLKFGAADKESAVAVSDRTRPHIADNPGATVEGHFTNELTPPNISSLVQVPTLDEHDVASTGDVHQFIASGTHASGIHASSTHGDDDDDHDDDDDNDALATYSLSKVLAREPGGQASLGTLPHVEVVTTGADEKVVDFHLVRRGQGKWLRRPGALRRGDSVPLGLHWISVNAQGQCKVVCDDDVEWALRRGAQTLGGRDVATAGPGRGRSHATLLAGDTLSVRHQQMQFSLRFVHPPPLPPDNRGFWQRISLEGKLFNTALASCIAHLLLALIVTLLTPKEEPAAAPPEFVVTEKKDLALQDPPPKVQPPPEPPEPPRPPAPPERPQKHIRRKAPHPRRPEKAVAQAPRSPAPPGVLGLLSKKGATAAPGPVAAVQAVSNLTSVKSPGNSGSFRVSGLVGKLPASAGISTGGGGGGIVTKGGAALLRGGGGAARLRDQGDRHVGGLVQKAPRAMQTTGQGSLDRALIEKVVNEHTDEIQRCYERELLRDNALQGKLQVEWIINLEGTVPSVRQIFSSVNSVGLVTCIMSAIKTWRFPRPQGGSVVVSYPFILKGIDF